MIMPNEYKILPERHFRYKNLTEYYYVNNHYSKQMPAGNYYNYVTTNPAKTVLYTGVTNNLRRRILEHYDNKGNKKTFAGRYYCYKLIYYEYFTDINQAIQREKEIKDMSRERKEN